MVKFDVIAEAPQGYEVNFQVEGEKAYQDALKMLEQMEKDGFRPKTNGKPGSEQKVAPNIPESASQGQQNGIQVCPIHGKSKEGKGGRLYCPTRMEDGSWCKWRPEKSLTSSAK